LFSDTAAIRAMLLVEGALARAQGTQGIIPELSAKAIQRATMEIQIDPGALAQSTGENGVSVPGLVAAFRTEMNAPEHAQYVHWGATSQDIIDTALMLRLRQLLLLAEADLRSVIAALATQAEQHADTPMAGRTYGQQATVTSWGAVIADWGQPLIDLLDALPALRSESMLVSLSGAAGTSSALGPHAAETRAALAEGLGLGDPKRSWHVDRGPILQIVDWLTQVTWHDSACRLGDCRAAIGRIGCFLHHATKTKSCRAIGFGCFGPSGIWPARQLCTRYATFAPARWCRVVCRMDDPAPNCLGLCKWLGAGQDAHGKHVTRHSPYGPDIAQ